ncbi:hypothetical protein UlMin_035898 [Ulmus minor]
MRAVDGDGLVDQQGNADVSTLENSLSNECGVCKDSLNDNQSNADVCKIESGCECLKEGGLDGMATLLGDSEIPSVVIPGTVSPRNSVRQDEQKDDKSASYLCVKAHIEVMEEKDDVLAGLKGDLCEQASLLLEMCAVDGDRLVDQHENADVSSLEHSLNNECVVSEGSLNENQSNVDFFNMESGGDCLKEGGPGGQDDLSNLSGDSKIPLFVIPGVDSPRNYVRLEEQKNDKSASGLPVEPATEVIEEKDDVLTDIKSDLCEQASLLPDFETFSPLIPENGGLSDNGEQNDLDFQSVNSPSLENLNQRSVASAGKESDKFDRVTSLLHGEMHVEVSHTNEEVSTSDWKNDQEEDSCLSATMVNMTDSTIKLSHSACLLETFEDVSESPCSCAEQNEQMNTVIGNPPADKVMGRVVEKSDVTADIKLDVGSRMLPLEEKGCNLNEGSKCILDISASSLGVVNDDSSERLIVSIEQNDASGPPKSSRTLDCSGKVDDEGKDYAKVDCVFESKSCDIVPSSSKRSKKRSKSNRKAPAKPSRKSRNGSKVLCPGESIKVALGDAKKKRSCSFKRVRSSMWGSLGNVTQLFEQTNGLKAHNSKSHKSKGGQKGGKQNKSGTKGRSESSRSNQAENTTLRLKVKLGKEVNQRFMNSMDPDVFDISTLSTAISRNLGTELCSQNSRGSTKVVNSAIDEWGEGDEEAKSCQGASVLDAQPASNGLDSNLIGENSAGDVRDNCLSMSSDMVMETSGEATDMVMETSGEATEIRCKDPGTSPDSEVINLTPDPRADSRPDEDFQSSVLTSAKNYTVPGDRTSNRRGEKKNTLSGSDSCIVEDRSCQPAKVNKAKTAKPYGRKKNISNTICFDENLTSADVNAFSNSSSDKELSAKPGHLSGETQLGVSIKSFKVDSGTDAKTNCNLDMGLDASGNPLSDRDLFVDPLHFSGETGLGVNPETFKVESGVEAKTNCNLDIGLNNSRNSLSGEELSAKLLHLPGNTVIGGSAWEVQVDSEAEAKTHGNLEIALRLSRSGKSKNFLPAAKTKGNKIPKGNSKGSDSGSKRVNACSQKETQRKSGSKKKTKEKAVHNPVACEVKICPEADGTGKMSSGDNVASTSLPQLGVPSDLGLQYLPQQDAWVCCDNCFQWRRISAEDADIINELKCTWICANNKNKAFADCSIPQEKSNAEINAELDISEVSGDENAEELGCKLPKVSRQTVTRIRTNQFLHRSRKTLTIDQIMVCDCKPPPDGKLGCGDKCLNRLLTIECVQGACPCGDRCSNRQFQKRHYAKLQKFRSGKKGFGLKLLEDLSEGQFLIEYVGEVLDMQAYLARQKEYALKGHKHFYFMTLNGSEVIDACVKGNLGRYINHSCDPNCRTEKWMVSGEVCIGLFALRDIKKGEEVTFDYNYERVFGAAAKKCYCGSPQCRGYIGGDPHNSEVVVYSDSDEEYSEVVTPPEDAETEESLENRMPRAGSSDGDIMQTSERDKKTNAVGELEMSTGMESVNQSVSAVLLLHDALELNSNVKLPSAVQPLETLQQTEDVKLMSAAQRDCSMEESSVEKSSNTKMLGKSLCEGFDGNRKSKVDDKQVSSKERSNLKTSRSSSSVKKGKVKHSAQNSSKVQVGANRSQVLPINSKKKIEGSFVNHFEAVEENLNVLLDVAGGIRRDASRGYLKLLLLTAASGESANGEAIQRNRDLSMILDALLKTKSQRVLEDIIKKNGLRMLHNIMKQHRGDFKKIPILRKLLKVLEYLADHEILKPDHINGGPPCPGMESFQESILSLTEHDDRQVHRIARKFRDKWIRRPLRKHGRDDNRTELYRGSNCNRFSASQNNWSDHGPRHTESKDCFEKSMVATNLVDEGIQEGSSAPCVGISPTRTTKTRKRKSRWDQPAEIKPDLSCLQHREKQIKQLKSSSSPRNELPSDVYKLNREDKFCSSSLHDGKKNIFEDIPPGFSSPLKPHVSPPVAPTPMACDLKRGSDTVIGHPQEKFVSRLPVSYGIPLSIMQQFGTPSSEPVGSWVIAPGMPFHPFPPLPPGPRVKKDPSPSEHVNHLSASQPAEERRHECHLPASFHSNESSPGSIGNQPVMDISSTNNQYASKRGRESSCDLGRRYFKQQKLNNTKSGPPPWHWRSNGWGCAENSKGGGSSNNVSVGNVSNELSGTYCPEGLSSSRVENAGNNFYQHPEQHPSQH